MQLPPLRWVREQEAGMHGDEYNGSACSKVEETLVPHHSSRRLQRSEGESSPSLFSFSGCSFLLVAAVIPLSET
jgi:hypothetical protein